MSLSILYLLQNEGNFLVSSLAMVECEDGYTDGHLLAKETGSYQFKNGKMVKMPPNQEFDFTKGDYAIVGEDLFICQLLLGIKLGRQIEKDRSLLALLN